MRAARIVVDVVSCQKSQWQWSCAVVFFYETVQTVFWGIVGCHENSTRVQRPTRLLTKSCHARATIQNWFKSIDDQIQNDSISHAYIYITVGTAITANFHNLLLFHFWFKIDSNQLVVKFKTMAQISHTTQWTQQSTFTLSQYFISGQSLTRSLHHNLFLSVLAYLCTATTAATQVNVWFNALCVECNYHVVVETNLISHVRPRLVAP